MWPVLPLTPELVESALPVDAAWPVLAEADAPQFALWLCAVPDESAWPVDWPVSVLPLWPALVPSFQPWLTPALALATPGTPALTPAETVLDWPWLSPLDQPLPCDADWVALSVCDWLAVVPAEPPLLTPTLAPCESVCPAESVCACPDDHPLPWLSDWPLETVLPHELPLVSVSDQELPSLCATPVEWLSVWLPESVWDWLSVCAAESVCAWLTVCAPETVWAALSVCPQPTLSETPLELPTESVTAWLSVCDVPWLCVWPTLWPHDCPSPWLHPWLTLSALEWAVESDRPDVGCVRVGERGRQRDGDREAHADVAALPRGHLARVARHLHQRARDLRPRHVRGGDLEDEVLAQLGQAPQQVLALLAQQLVVRDPHGAVAAQPLLRQPRVGMAQDRQDFEPLHALDQQAHAADVGRDHLRLRVVGEGRLDRGHAPAGFARPPLPRCRPRRPRRRTAPRPGAPARTRPARCSRSPRRRCRGRAARPTACRACRDRRGSRWAGRPARGRSPRAPVPARRLAARRNQK